MAALRRVLVIGGGIGGLTAAVALRRQNVAVDLVELHPTWTVYGVGIIQPNNTLRALDKIGLAQACVEAGAPFPGWRQYNQAGELLFEGAPGSSAAPGFPPVNGLTRPCFQDILVKAAEEAGASLRLGVTVTGWRDEGPEVAVTFSDGGSGAYDLMVGCDGIQSPTRRHLFGNVFDPVFSGQSVWRYNLDRPDDMVWGGVFFGDHSKVGLVPISPKLMYMFLVTEEPGNPRFETERMADLMRQRIAGYGGGVARLAPQITDPHQVVYRPIENVMVPSPWYKGRVLLIGDAAHATTPHLNQGAAMAIEDAVLLGELAGAGLDVSALLDSFMKRRFKRASYVVESSKQIATWEMEEWAGIKSPGADPGGLHYRASVAMLEDF